MNTIGKTRYSNIPIITENRKLEQNNSTRKPNLKNLVFLLGVSGILGIVVMSSHGARNESFTDEPTSNTTVTSKCPRRIIGYYDQGSKKIFTSEQLSKLTHLIIEPTLDMYNITHLFYKARREKELKELIKIARNVTDLKIMFSLKFSKIHFENPWRKDLMTDISLYLHDFQLDGFDMDVKWLDPATEFSKVVEFCKELKLLMHGKPLLISAIYPKHKPSIDFQGVLEHFDFLTIHTSNYYAPWIRSFPYLIGPPSPLYSKHGKLPKENIDHSMMEYSCSTKQPNKLNILIAFTSIWWDNVVLPENSSDTFWMRAEPKRGGYDGGWLSWDQLKSGSRWKFSKVSWNNDSKTPYIWIPEKQSYLAFENKRSMRAKLKYAMSKNIGGLAVWRIEHDDEANTMLGALSSENFNSEICDNSVKYDCD